MFKPYYKFIDEVTKEITYIRNTKSALKCIKKNLNKYVVIYVADKGTTNSLLYSKSFLYTDNLTKSQIKYCHALFKNDTVAVTKTIKLTSKSKYQLRQSIIKKIKYFNNLDEKRQADVIYHTAWIHKSIHKNIDSTCVLDELFFIKQVVEEFKNDGAIIKDESNLYLQK